MRIYSRASWGARYVDGVGNRPVGSLQKYLHHSVTKHLPATATVAQEKAQCRVVESIGQQRFGRGISYTFLVFPSGRVYQGASVHRISYHSGGGRDGKPRNTLGVGICLVGNTEANEMTSQQVTAVVQLLQEGVRRGWWNDPAITEGHRDFKATSCPGRHAYKLISEINRRGRGGRASGVSSTPAPSGPSARPDVEVQLALAALGMYDAGPGLQYLDGKNGDHQKAAVRKYQKSRGLHEDGWWGTNTDSYFEENDMPKIVDQIAAAVKAEVPSIGEIRNGQGFHAGKVHEAVIRELAPVLAKLDGLEEAVRQLATGQGLDPDAISAAIEAGVNDALDRVRVVIAESEEESNG